jgi:hypothetical protein
MRDGTTSNTVSVVFILVLVATLETIINCSHERMRGGVGEGGVVVLSSFNTENKQLTSLR